MSKLKQLYCSIVLCAAYTTLELVLLLVPSLPAATLDCSLERGGGEAAEHSPQQVSRAREQVIHVEQLASGMSEHG